MTTATEVTDRYAERLEQLARNTQARTVALFDQVAPWSYADAGTFHEAATPFMAGSAQASVDLTAAYASIIHSGPLGSISNLIVADAAARAFTPFDKLAHALSLGYSMAEAVAQARSVAATLGHDTIWRSARQALGRLIPSNGWMRRVSATSCDWCMELSDVVFDTAEEATFGHDHDKCIAIPADVLGDHNQTVIDQRGWSTPEAVEERARHDQATALRRQIETAQRRQAEAKAEAATETDPVRRERLETREQEWETRAEAAAERLRILLTGTHRLPQ